MIVVVTSVLSIGSNAAGALFMRARKKVPKSTSAKQVVLVLTPCLSEDCPDLKSFPSAIPVPFGIAQSQRVVGGKVG